MEENELLYWLGEQELDIFLLLVEGNTDIRFWSLLAPIALRNRTVIYPIDRIDVPGGPRSARGRALFLADRLRQTEVSDRVKFFLDADADHLLGRNCPLNVILTDYRDLEAYAFHVEAMRSVLFSFGHDPDGAEAALAVLGRIVRPCGLVRLMDEIHQLALPFQRTWRSGLTRQIKGAKQDPQVPTSILFRALLQNADISLSRLTWAEGCLQAVAADYAAVDTLSLAHGKDLISAISWRFTVGYDEAERAVLAALAESRHRILQQPQLRLAHDFVLQ